MATAYQASGTVAQNVRILARAPGGAVLRTGERRRVAKIDLDGKSGRRLVASNGLYRLGSVAQIPLGSPNSVNASCFEFTVAFYKQPWKKVEKWDEYRMVKDRLKYVGSAKCVSYGAHAWAFDPSEIPERGNTDSLLGYQRGWQWENAERSPVFPGQSGGQP